ncbi:MAG: hypothetical protein ACP5KN_14280 [Armatimonadota bacterium]
MSTTRPAAIPALLLLPGLLMAASPAWAAAYTEVWPLPLTEEVFLLRIPAAGPQPDLPLRVRIMGDDGQPIRTARARATWEELRWPDEVWAQAGLPEDQPPVGGWLAEIPIGGLQPGTYRFVAIAEPGGREFVAPEVTLHERPAWMDARAGVEGLNVVLEPWEPVTAQRRGGELALGCWNRETVLADDDTLVRQITSGGREVLAGPLTLRADDPNGLPLRWDSPWRLSDRSKPQVTATRELLSDAARATVSVTQEYDGLTWLDLDLSDDSRLSGLELSVPVSREIASWIYYYPDLPWFFGNIRNVIATPRPRYGWSAGLLHWLFVGGPDAGLFLWCDEAWHGLDEPGAAEVLSYDGAAEIRLHLPERLASERRHFRFALQATPVKPWPEHPLHNRVSTFNWSPQSVLAEYEGAEGFQGLYIDRLRQAGYEVIHLGEWWTTAWGGVEPRDPEALRTLVEEAHERGMRVIVYFGYETDESVPAAQKFPYEIFGGDPRLKTPKEHRFYGPARYDESLPSRKAWGSDRSGPERERILAGMERLLAEYHLDGFYLDGTQLPTGDLGRARELMKRMRFLVDGYTGGRGVIYAHTSSRNNIAVNAFADVVYNGEQLRYVPELRDLEALGGALPVDYLMLLMNGRPWGVPHDLCAGRPAYVDMALLLGTGAGTYQWSEERWPLRRLWLSADLWSAHYTPPHVASSRWSDRPPETWVAAYRSGDLHTVVLYTAQAADLDVALPASAVLGLADDAELTAPEVVWWREEVAWEQADTGAWRGTVPSCGAVVLQARSSVR